MTRDHASKIFLIIFCSIFLGNFCTADAGLKENILKYGIAAGCSLVGGWLFYCMSYHASDRGSYSDPPEDNYCSDFSSSWKIYLVAGTLFEVAAVCIAVLPSCKKFYQRKKTQEGKESSMKSVMANQNGVKPKRLD